MTKDLSLIQNTHTSLLSNKVVLLKNCYTRTTQHPEKKTRRKRNVTWFNPPFSSDVEPKIGKKLFNILNKYFPKHHHLHKVINKNTVKLSYCCMLNVGRLLKAQNQKVPNNTKATPPTKIPQLATAETKRVAHCRANDRSNELFTRPMSYRKTEPRILT